MKKNKTPGDKRPVPKIDANAELFAAWTYRRLLNGKDSTPYPLEGASVHWQEGSNVKLEVPPPAKEPEPPKPLTGQEAFGKIKELKKLYEQAAKLAGEITTCDQVKIWLEAKPSDMHSMIVPDLCSALLDAIWDAQEELAWLANVGSVKATHTLFFTSYKGADELRKLYRSKPNLVKHVAQTEAYWPVNYSPHGDAQDEIEKMIDALDVGGPAAMKRERVTWSNKPKSGQPHSHIVSGFATSMFWTLNRIHRDGTLRSYLKRNPPGWPQWAYKLVKLPPITKTSARDWVACGIEALEEAADGSVANIKELSPVGASNKAYAVRRSTTDKGRNGKQASRIEGQIKAALRGSFIARFGN